ncbi:zinc uptake transcriptional repressor Zur [Vibrio profundum]|uniref:zinc uptake transcriptional repressor Zur n=1 Tax=Vibrio profundum TaxID=2910247 RepID=UPI003D1056C9
MVRSLDQHKIKQVEAICSERGVRLTPQRRRVFELIDARKKASSAYELLEELKISEPHAKPPTVYRALDFLLEQGFIHRVESTNSFISCCFGDADKHFSQLLICDVCGDVVEIQDESLVSQLEKNAAKHGYTIANHVIESHGVCEPCCSNVRD